VSDPIPRHHANVFTLKANGFDVALEFGYRASAEEETEPVVRVTMSWEHLRVMMPILEGALAEFERQVGPIPRVDEAASRQPEGVGR